jgi:chemotaxis protein methyltransferase CheR
MRNARELDLSRFRLLATDIDRRSLLDAHAAEYGTFALSELPQATRERWFEGPNRTRLRAEVRGMVQFQELDLMTEPYPSDQHLVLCRNVVIYFERKEQEGVFQRFHGALASGGYLLLGKVETLFGEPARAFRTLAPRERLFRKT